MPRPRTERTRTIAAFCQEHPELTGVAIAVRFGVTRQWISHIVHNAGMDHRRVATTPRRVIYEHVCQDCGTVVQSEKWQTSSYEHCGPCQQAVVATRWEARRKYPLTMALRCTCCGTTFVKWGKGLAAYLIGHKKRPTMGTNCGSCRGHGARKMTCLEQRKAPAVAGA